MRLRFTAGFFVVLTERERERDLNLKDAYLVFLFPIQLLSSNQIIRPPLYQTHWPRRSLKPENLEGVLLPWRLHRCCVERLELLGGEENTSAFHAKCAWLVRLPTPNGLCSELFFLFWVVPEKGVVLGEKSKGFGIWDFVDLWPNPLLPLKQTRLADRRLVRRPAMVASPGDTEPCGRRPTNAAVLPQAPLHRR